MIYFVSPVFGYLFGSLNPAYIFGRLKGFDIRERGSHNAGASNAKICLGWKYFFMVVAIDVSKAVLVALVIRNFLQGDQFAQILGSCFAVIGHCFPFYLQFKGGKGFAAFIGVAAIINFKVFAIIIFASLILAYLTNYIVVATLILTISLPLVAYLMNLSLPCVICLGLTATMIIFQHRSNFIKFFHKEEIGINGKYIGIDLRKGR